MLHTVNLGAPTNPIPPQALDAFAHDGAILLKSLLDPADYAPILQNLAQQLSLLEQHYQHPPTHLANHTAGISERIVQLEQAHPGCQKRLTETMTSTPELHHFANDHKLMSAVQALLYHTVEIHPHVTLLMSLPEDEWHWEGWHQDGHCSRDPQSMITLYAPLQRTNIHNGSQLLALGEHHRGLLPHGEQQGNTQLPTIQPEKIKSFERVVSAELEVGDVLIFNSLTPHTTRLNQSNTIRFAINLQIRDLSSRLSLLQKGWRLGPIQQAHEALVPKDIG